MKSKTNVFNDLKSRAEISSAIYIPHNNTLVSSKTEIKDAESEEGTTDTNNEETPKETSGRKKAGRKAKGNIQEVQI